MGTDVSQDRPPLETLWKIELSICKGLISSADNRLQLYTNETKSTSNESGEIRLKCRNQLLIEETISWKERTWWKRRKGFFSSILRTKTWPPQTCRTHKKKELYSKKNVSDTRESNNNLIWIKAQQLQTRQLIQKVNNIWSLINKSEKLCTSQ